MTIELDERARRAGAELRAVADERARSLHPPVPARNGRRPLVLAAGAAVVVLVVVVAGLVMDGLPEGLEIDPVSPTGPDPSIDLSLEQTPGPVADANGWLPVPDVGGVTAAYREDLTPVFISHPADGEVLVLDPIDPHRPFELDKLVAFCPSSGWFEDLYHGARFNAWGDWTGGPAPSGLATYPIELATDGTRVRLTGDLQPAPERDDPRGEEQSPVGPSCVRDDDEPADIVGHRPPPSPPTLAGDAIPVERWVWATLVLGGEPGEAVVCDPDGTCGPDAPPVTFALGQPGTQIERAPVTYLARREPDGHIRILHPADPTDGGYTQLTTRDQAPLSVPPPGTAIAVTLRDSTPVFATHSETGDIHLLAASSPEDPAHLLGWCLTDQSLHGSLGRYAPDGRNLADADGRDLARYDIEVEDIGETRAIRITGPPASEAEGAATPDAQPPPSCGTELVTHQPTSADHVSTAPTGSR